MREVTYADLAEAMEGVFGPIPGRPSRTRRSAEDVELESLCESIFGARPSAVKHRPRSASHWDELAEVALGPRPAGSPAEDDLDGVLRNVFGARRRGGMLL